jgi:hypothetical protein
LGERNWKIFIQKKKKYAGLDEVSLELRGDGTITVSSDPRMEIQTFDAIGKVGHSLGLSANASPGIPLEE